MRRASSRPNSKCSNSRRGTACPTTAPARRCRSVRGGWPRCTGCRPASTARNCWSPRSMPLLQRVLTPFRIREIGARAASRARASATKALPRCCSRQGYTRTDTVIDHGEFAVRGSIFDIFPSGLDAGPAARLLRRRAGKPAAVRSRHPAHHRDDRRAPAAARQRGAARRGQHQALPQPLSRACSAPTPRRTRSTRRSATGGGWPGWSTGCRCSRTGWRRCSTISADDDADRDRLRRARCRRGTLRRHRRLPPTSARDIAGQAGGQLSPAGNRRALSVRDEFGAALAGCAGPPRRHLRRARKRRNVSTSASARRAISRPNARAATMSTKPPRSTSRRSAKAGRKPLFAAYSNGSRSRIASILEEAGAPSCSWPKAGRKRSGWRAKGQAAAMVLPLDTGFANDDARTAHRAGPARRPAGPPAQEAQGFRRLPRRTCRRCRRGDLVVHIDHGIGKYLGLEPIPVGQEPARLRDAGICRRRQALHPGREHRRPQPLRLSEEARAARPARRRRLAEAPREAQGAHPRDRRRAAAGPPPPARCARRRCSSPRRPATTSSSTASRGRKPTTRTAPSPTCCATCESGKPMDRLVCGDVGFGKTEVALRAAFVAAMSGQQVAVVAPTTLLARQHYQNFAERFAGFPLKVGRLSRASCPRRDEGRTREGLADGTIDVVIGTHAILSKIDRSSSELGLVIVDEEQRFGVTHKERLKQLRADVHVLTLTATPIPRTLQMAMTRPARAFDHPDPAGRPARGAHLRDGMGRHGDARGAAARTSSRRAELHRRAAHRRHGRGRGLAARARARSASSSPPTAR